ncbi:MAG TPA: hypothetical protein VHR66_20730 [Gemmataceae bacterium]|jgi:hypothetical protein|nr:hypothetical protein [Gemmataceae bacterium]
MKTPLTLLAAALATSAFAVPPNAADPAEQKKAEELVRQLASPSYRDREKAATALIQMGRAARTALVEGKKSADAEVYNRCEQILPQAQALDLAFRLDRFLKDTDGKLEHDLPLWKQYREKIGTDDPARKLYAEMIKANGVLLAAVEEEPKRATLRVQQRYHEMYQEMFGSPNGLGRANYRPTALNAAELCCVLFAAAQPAYEPGERGQPDWMLANLYTQAVFANQLRDERAGVAYRKVFFNFLEARMDENTINNSVWTLCQYKLKEGADLMVKALKQKKIGQVYTKASAICCIGTLGSKEHLAAIADYLKDETEVQKFVGRLGRGTVKIQDVALAMSIHLSGKNPKDFGFAQWNVYPNQLIQYHQLGFTSDEDRAAAFKKWDEEAKTPTTPAKK